MSDGIDLKEIEQMLRDVGRSISPVSTASPMIERNLHDVIENEFNRGVDPYGKPWSPLKPSTLRKGRKPPPLTGPTRRLRGDIVIHADSAQVFVHIPAEYTTYHQFGAPSVNLAQREMVPTSGPSASWNKAITDAIDKAAEKNSR